MTEIGKNETLKTESHLIMNQNLKILYLQDEIKQLHEKIYDLEEMLKFNKDALKMALNMTPSLPSVKKSTTSNSNQDKSTKEEESTNDKTLKSIIFHMDEENARLLLTIDKLTKERNAAQSKALINEQIAEEAQQHESDVVLEFESKVSEMLRAINEKEKKIQEFEKIKPIMDREGLIVQYREVLSPSEQIMKLHNDLEWTKSILLKTCREVNRLQSEKNELLTINFNLVAEINKLRVSLVSPLNNSTKTNIQDLNQSAMALLNLHKKFLDDSSEEDPLSPMNEPFPEKVNRNKKERSDTTPDLKSKNIIGKGIPIGLKIPKLDLTQAKKIQEINAKKSSQQALPKADNKIYEKFHQMEAEMEKTKKLMQKEMGHNKVLIEQIEAMRNQNKEILAINETLVNSQKKYEEKWRKLYHALVFYKEFYHKYLEEVLSKATNKSQDFQIINKYREQHTNFELLFQDPEKKIRENNRKNDEAGKLVNVSILDITDDQMKADQKLKRFFQISGKQEYKNYLKNLSKEVNNLFGEKICKENKNPTNVHFKRSLSNPIDYQTEVKKIWLESMQKPISSLLKGPESVLNNEKNLNKSVNLNFNIPLKSPDFGIKYKENNQSEEILGLESPEQIIYHTNYEEEEIS